MSTNSVNIIWLNTTYNGNTFKIDNATHLSLCRIDPCLLTFHDLDKCLDYITTFKNTKVVLIITTSGGTHCKSG